MPLVKAICKKCQNENEYDILHWDSYDDKAWKKGWVNCPHILGLEDFGQWPQPLVKDDAPAYCRYAMEHTVMNPSNSCEIDGVKDGFQGQEKKRCH